jgi:hypothetical protein
MCCFMNLSLDCSRRTLRLRKSIVARLFKKSNAVNGLSKENIIIGIFKENIVYSYFNEQMCPIKP